jgi:hypothetical protein
MYCELTSRAADGRSARPVLDGVCYVACGLLAELVDWTCLADHVSGEVPAKYAKIQSL